MQHGAANRSRHGSLWRQPSFQRGYQGFPAADMAPVSECPQSDSNAICGSYRLLVLVRACPGVATPRKGPDTRLTYQGAECRPLAEMRRINNMARADRDTLRNDGTFDGTFQIEKSEIQYPCDFQGCFRFLSSHPTETWGNCDGCAWVMRSHVPHPMPSIRAGPLRCNRVTVQRPTHS